MSTSSDFEILQVEDALWVLLKATEYPTYDFDFASFFAGRHIVFLRGEINAIGRIGAAADYAKRYNEFQSLGIRLVHSPAEHLRCAHLPEWYPLLKELTPRSLWFDRLPTYAELKSEFSFPLFIKGERQTSKHRRELCVVETEADYERVRGAFLNDPILSWQRAVVREYIPLRAVGTPTHNGLPHSFEFRSFWYRGKLAGIGKYWIAENYDFGPNERSAALRVAQEAVERINVAFPVVDVAQTANGKWVVIECNDGQESGHAGVAPLPMWRKIIDVERARL